MTRPAHETTTFFQRLKKGLEDSIAHSRGERTLRTTELPAPPPAASPARVAALRRRLRMSQSVFAAALNVSPKLVQSWEQGLRTPDRGDLRLIQLIEQDPGLLAKLFPPPARPAPRRPGRPRPGIKARA
jgi:putative transcriptional regulator